MPLEGHAEPTPQSFDNSILSPIDSSKESTKSSRENLARDCLRVYMEEKNKLASALKGQIICLTTNT